MEKYINIKKRKERESSDDESKKAKEDSSNDGKSEIIKDENKNENKNELPPIPKNAPKIEVSKEVDPTRVREISNNSGSKRAFKVTKGSTIVYWMSRDQRVNDNWSLLYAQELAQKNKLPLVVVFNLTPTFLGACYRQWAFLIKGIQEVEESLEKNLQIPFVLTRGDPVVEIPKFLEEAKASAVVCEFNPLKIYKDWHRGLVDNTKIPVYEVDSHNIVPAWVASDKQEVAARTIRIKITKLLPKYLLEYPPLVKSEIKWEGNKKAIKWDEIYEYYKTNSSRLGPDIDWITPGETAAHKALKNFLEKNLKRYSDSRNDPTLDGQSGLSPFFHFGTLSSQRVILEVQPYKNTYKESYNSFLDELVVRKELSENFCYYNPNYDNFDGFANWSKESLNIHESDTRQYIYTLKEFEEGKTHDDLWNAAQLQMVNTGKMHGFMRMYWGKKILEWTKNARDAMKIAVEMNDKYELDGRDPNGYVGCAWSIGGIHDQGWKERPIFGKVRYMNYEGCKRKFNVVQYVKKYLKKPK